ncbi:hypothetical protein V6V89_40700, partial [Micromonospora sp. CPCC 206061]
MSSRTKRIIGVLATLVVFGGIITVTQVSSARERNRGRAPAACRPAPNGTAPEGQQNVTQTRQNGRTVRNYWGDGQACTGTGAPTTPPSNNNGTQGPNQPSTQAPTTTAPPPLNKEPNTCEEGSNLPIHDGFQ